MSVYVLGEIAQVRDREYDFCYYFFLFNFRAWTKGEHLNVRCVLETLMKLQKQGSSWQR